MYLTTKTLWSVPNGRFINALRMIYAMILPWIQNPLFQKIGKKDNLIWFDHNIACIWTVDPSHSVMLWRAKKPLYLHIICICDGKSLKRNTLWQKVREFHIISCPCDIIWNRRIWNQLIECKLLPTLLWITKCSRDFWDM